MLCGSGIWNKKTECLVSTPRKWSRNHPKNGTEENQSNHHQVETKKFHTGLKPYMTTAFPFACWLLLSPPTPTIKKHFKNSNSFIRKKKKPPKRWSKHSLGERGQAASSWRSDPVSMSAAGRAAAGAEGCWDLRRSGRGPGPREVPCYLGWNALYGMLPGFSLCVNTWFIPVTKVWACPLPNLLLPPFPPHRIIRELIVIFYCNLSNRSSSCLDVGCKGPRLLRDFHNVYDWTAGPRIPSSFHDEDFIWPITKNPSKVEN